MSRSRQLALDLPARPARGRGDFFVSASNRLAVAQIDGWRDWPGGRCALVGPEGAGKSHLAAVWAAETGARVIAAADLPEADPAGLAAGGAVAVEDADRALAAPAGPAVETALFHLHERLAAAGGALLLTGRAAPGRWPAALADLRSRLAAVPVARIEPPDDLLLEALAIKLFADRGVAVERGLPRWLALRAPRSHAGLAEAVARLDRLGLARGVRLTRNFASKALDADMEASPPPR